MHIDQIQKEDSSLSLSLKICCTMLLVVKMLTIFHRASMQILSTVAICSVSFKQLNCLLLRFYVDQVIFATSACHLNYDPQAYRVTNVILLYC